MNQIIQLPKNKNRNKDKKHNNINTINQNKKKIIKLLLKLQLYASLFLIIITLSILIRNSINIYEKEKYSSEILNSYNITRIYSNLYSKEKYDDLDNENQETYVIGIIKIPKFNVNYPIFSNYNDDLLKISPCRIYGPLPGKNGNLCVAGHNYDNNKFFSKIMDLKINDEIIIYNNAKKYFSYFVKEIYEVEPTDFSPLYNYDKNKKQLTLITCNNLNNNRIIVKSIIKNKNDSLL